MKKIENIVLRLRKVNKKSLGITIPKEIVKKFKLLPGLEVSICVEFENKKQAYRCGVCGYEFVEEIEEREVECQSCGEMRHLIKINEFTRI